MAEDLGLEVDWFEPDPAGGKGQTYSRDYELVGNATHVTAYFSPEAIMEGGTGHVVEAALAREIDVDAWVVDDRGQIQRVGEVP